MNNEQMPYRNYGERIPDADIFKIPVTGMRRSTVCDGISFHIDEGHLHWPQSWKQFERNLDLAFYIECGGRGRVFRPERGISIAAAQDEAIWQTEIPRGLAKNASANKRAPHCRVIETRLPTIGAQLFKGMHGATLFVAIRHPCPEVRARLSYAVQAAQEGVCAAEYEIFMQSLMVSTQHGGERETH